MKFLNSKKGFTLIELLVVIGILAVLAAIAIPSVAGLIDRANVSADQTNANEMTNAMERFASEYELYRQDIASGLIKDADDDGTPDNLDAAQGRVYNVTGAKTLEDIQNLESAFGYNGLKLDIDTKYPQNIKTTKAIINNYTKTSSSTFEPKQSDMSYWYNTTTGYVVVAPTDIDVEKLKAYLPHEVNYDNEEVALNEWVDLAQNDETPEIVMTSMYKKNYSNRYGIIIQYKLPNKKHFLDFKYENFYILCGENEDNLTLDNNYKEYCFGEHATDDNIQAVLNSNEKYLTFHSGFLFTEEEANRTLYYRLCYVVEDTGTILYSPIQEAIQQELPTTP